jgi:hypothetical protein
MADERSAAEGPDAVIPGKALEALKALSSAVGLEFRWRASDETGNRLRMVDGVLSGSPHWSCEALLHALSLRTLSGGRSIEAATTRALRDLSRAALVGAVEARGEAKRARLADRKAMAEETAEKLEAMSKRLTDESHQIGALWQAATRG